LKIKHENILTDLQQLFGKTRYLLSARTTEQKLANWRRLVDYNRRKCQRSGERFVLNDTEDITDNDNWYEEIFLTPLKETYDQAPIDNDPEL
jgi:hypothetical protein